MVQPNFAGNVKVWFIGNFGLHFDRFGVVVGVVLRFIVEKDRSFRSLSGSVRSTFAIQDLASKVLSNMCTILYKSANPVSYLSKKNF